MILSTQEVLKCILPQNGRPIKSLKYKKMAAGKFFAEDIMYPLQSQGNHGIGSFSSI